MTKKILLLTTVVLLFAGCEASFNGKANATGDDQTRSDGPIEEVGSTAEEEILAGSDATDETDSSGDDADDLDASDDSTFVEIAVSDNAHLKIERFPTGKSLDAALVAIEDISIANGRDQVLFAVGITSDASDSEIGDSILEFSVHTTASANQLQIVSIQYFGETNETRVVLASPQVIFVSGSNGVTVRISPASVNTVYALVNPIPLSLSLVVESGSLVQTLAPGVQGGEVKMACVTNALTCSLEVVANTCPDSIVTTATGSVIPKAPMAYGTCQISLRANAESQVSETQTVEVTTPVTTPPSLSVIRSPFFLDTSAQGQYGRSLGVDDEIFMTVSSNAPDVECLYPGESDWESCNLPGNGILDLKAKGSGGMLKLRATFDGVGFTEVEERLHKFTAVTCSQTVTAADGLTFDSLKALEPTNSVICFEDGVSIVNASGSTMNAMTISTDTVFIARAGDVVTVENQRTNGTDYTQRGIFVSAFGGGESLAVVGLQLKTSGADGYAVYCYFIDSCIVDGNLFTYQSTASGSAIYVRGNSDLSSSTYIKQNKINSSFHGISTFVYEGGYWEVVGNQFQTTITGINISGAYSHTPSIIAYNQINAGNMGIQLDGVNRASVEFNNITAVTRGIALYASGYEAQYFNVHGNSVVSGDVGLTFHAGWDGAEYDDLFASDNIIRTGGTGIELWFVDSDSIISNTSIIRNSSGAVAKYGLDIQLSTSPVFADTLVCYEPGANDWSVGTGPAINDPSGVVSTWTAPPQSQIGGPCP